MWFKQLDTWSTKGGVNILFICDASTQRDNAPPTYTPFISKYTCKSSWAKVAGSKLSGSTDIICFPD